MRIGINVPSELMKKVKAIRPAVNVSQICREALDERVRVGERAIAQAEADGVDEQVVRLAESLGNSLIEPDWETYALEDAREWVREGDGPDELGVVHRKLRLTALRIIGMTHI